MVPGEPKVKKSSCRISVEGIVNNLTHGIGLALGGRASWCCWNWQSGAGWPACRGLRNLRQHSCMPLLGIHALPLVHLVCKK